MSKLVYVGNKAGLLTAGTDKAGDMNSPADYVLSCGCGVELGPLVRFSPNAEGHRSCFCPRCKHVTIVKKDGAITYIHAHVLLQKTA